MSREKKVKKQKAKGTQRLAAAMLIICAIWRGLITGSMTESAAESGLDFFGALILLTFWLQMFIFIILSVLCLKIKPYVRARQNVSGIAFLTISFSPLYSLVNTLLHIRQYDLSDVTLYLYLIPRAMIAITTIALAILAFAKKTNHFRIASSVVYILGVLLYYAESVLSYGTGDAIEVPILQACFEIIVFLTIIIGVLGYVETICQSNLTCKPNDLINEL